MVWFSTPGLQQPLHAAREALCGLVDSRVEMVGGSAGADMARRLEIQSQCATVPGTGVRRVETDIQVRAAAAKPPDRGEHPILDVSPCLGSDWFVRVDRNLHQPDRSASEPEVDRDRHDHGDRHAVQEGRREPPLPDGIGRGIVEQRDPA